MTRTADVVIVGAGVIGASIALACARAGLTVEVVDRNRQPGHGSTSASAGIIRVHATDPATCALADAAILAWENWRDFTETASGEAAAQFTRCGSLILDTGSDFAKRASETMSEVGVEHRWVDAAEVATLVPSLDVGRFGPPRSLDDDAFWEDPDGDLPGGVHTAHSGYCADPALAAQNLADAARRAGARFSMGTAVVDISEAHGRVSSVLLADGNRVSCRAVVNAAGPHSTQVNQIARAGDDFKVGLRRIREELHVVPAPTGVNFETEGMHVVDDDLGINFRPEGGNTILVGGNGATVDATEVIEDPEVFNPNPTLPLWERNTIRLARRIRGLRIPSRPAGVAGLYDATDDWLPIYDRTRLDGYFVAIGTSGNQFKTAPVVGPLMRAVMDYCLAGHDHDASPYLFTAPNSERVIDTSVFSRLRAPQEGGTRG